MGQTRSPLCSQISEENPPTNNNRPTSASTLTSNATLIGIVEDADVSTNAAQTVADGVNAAVLGMGGYRTRQGDIISHIK